LFSRKSKDAETNIPYWYRPHRSPTKLPILFIHGIGIGLLPYVPLFRELVAQDPDVGILAIEILPISMRITAPPLDRDAMCAAITRILNAHGLHRVVLAGHSYGTAVSAHLLRRQWDSVDPLLNPLTTRTTQPAHESTNEYHVIGHDHSNAGNSNLIAATLLIDPIPFLIHYPAVAYNFVYRQPRHANEWQLWYFASREPDTARALSRHFFWFECILFREDVLGATSGGGHRSTSTSTSAAVEQGKKRPMPVTVSLAGRDQIVDARAVRAYLTGSKDPENEDEEQAIPGGGKGRAGVPPSRWEQDGLEVLYFSEMDHATVFDTPRDRAPLLDALRRFVRLDEEEDEEEDGGTKSVNGAGAAGAGAMLDGNLVDVE
jgi:pimeloyl-ACP methyl ester carboxylesterase